MLAEGDAGGLDGPVLAPDGEGLPTPVDRLDPNAVLGERLLPPAWGGGKLAYASSSTAAEHSRCLWRRGAC